VSASASVSGCVKRGGVTGAVNLVRRCVGHVVGHVRVAAVKKGLVSGPCSTSTARRSSDGRVLLVEIRCYG
jgi:hypothetical protein